MKKLGIAVLAMGWFASPALALEHEVVIEHAAGTIAAEYAGTVTVKTRQVGAAGVAGRPNTLRCLWSASLGVERTAKVGETLRSRRSMARGSVASGSRPGWCATQTKAINRLANSRIETFRAVMLAMVEQDVSAILAEADDVQASSRIG